MDIKFGSIEYFELLHLRDKLRSRHLDKLDLLSLDRLRTEVAFKIDAINKKQNDYLQATKRTKDEGA